MKPILRWAGGKRWLAQPLGIAAEAIGIRSYVEPFVGGGAVFFGHAWDGAILGDTNAELIRCYTGISEEPDRVRQVLSSLRVQRETFKVVKEWQPQDFVDSAARLLYLNRAAYGGIYRENRKGEFNVPFSGDRSLDSLLVTGRLEEVSQALRPATLVHADFERTLHAASKGSMIFCDPPYGRTDNDETFDRYGRAPFSRKDQERLAQAVRSSADSGSVVIVTNRTTDQVVSLYRGALLIPVSRMGGLSTARNAREEGVFVLAKDRDLAKRVAGILFESLLDGRPGRHCNGTNDLIMV